MSGTTPATLSVTWDPAVTSQICSQQSPTATPIQISGPANTVTVAATFVVSGVQTFQTYLGESGTGPQRTDLLGADRIGAADPDHQRQSRGRDLGHDGSAVDEPCRPHHRCGCRSDSSGDRRTGGPSCRRVFGHRVRQRARYCIESGPGDVGRVERRSTADHFQEQLHVHPDRWRPRAGISDGARRFGRRAGSDPDPAGPAVAVGGGLL